MGKLIKVLNDLTINKIAAGEVIEGPYSVVKELIENAIDAASRNITLEIRDGGKKYIRITDDGRGIYSEDLETAFMRHATSKITNLEDLNNIYTLGFRGEALASIASIAQVEIITKPRDQDYGVSLNIIGGEIISRKEVGCPDGTTIIVKNLFFNTPARFKFMKSSQAETAKISEMLTRLALSKPSIAFKYINNNNIMFTTSGDNNLEQTILSVLDKDLYKNLIPIKVEDQDVAIKGFISQPTYVRGNRNYEITFVNNRYIKSRLIYRAIEIAYKEKLPINKFPICVLNIKISPQLIDVNVHPSKTEVKFHNEDIIYNLIYHVIVKELSKETLLPKLSFKSQNSYHEKKDLDSLHSHANTFKEEQDNYYLNQNSPKETQIFFKEDSAIKTESEGDLPAKLIDGDHTKDAYKYLEVNTTQKNFLDSLLSGYKIIGQLFHTYIILEKDMSMYLIDQHAAHERLVYNQMLKAFHQGQVTAQGLLSPKVLELSHEDFIMVSQYRDKFHDFGFKIEVFGHNTIIIREVPLIMGIPRDFNFFIEILDELKKDNYHKTYFSEIIIRKSCREAIKANDKIEFSEMNQLINDLSTIDPPLTCPHGRPIILSLSKYEIEKSFKRIQ